VLQQEVSDATRRWGRYGVDPLGGIMTAGAAPLERVRGDLRARRMAIEALELLVNAIEEHPPHVEIPERAAGTVGAAFAVFDIERGAAVALRIRQCYDISVQSRDEHPLGPVIERVLHRDPWAAWELWSGSSPRRRIPPA